MNNIPLCPQCQSAYAYEDRNQFICPECGNEWEVSNTDTNLLLIKDGNGNVLVDGDSVTVIKDLKVKGSSNPIKQGTKIKSIRLIDDGIHNIDCKIPGFGAINLKSEFVKKS